MKYGRISRKEPGTTLGSLLVILFVLATFVCGPISSMYSWVTDERALERIEELLPEAQSVEIIRDSGNDIPILQAITDVTFEIQITYEEETVYASARCFDGIMREMVCRVYNTE